MSIDKPWNDVADQLRPARPDGDDLLADDDLLATSAVPEADPADVADQLRVVPLPDEQPWP